MTDDNIIRPDFNAKRTAMVFECRCDGQLYFLNHDGTIECRSCGLISQRIEWMYRKGESNG